MHNINEKYFVPGAIIIAGLFIAVSVVYTGGIGGPSGGLGQLSAPSADEQQPQDISVAPVAGDDHIFGNPDAPIKIIEFSDLECPFCQVLHPVLNQIIDEYDGQVVWVYRHMPLVGLHSKAPREAEASECATYLGGNDAFWAYINRLFEITPANNGLADRELYNIASYINLDSVAFAECLDSDMFAEKVENQTHESINTVSNANSGRVGTPYSVIIAPDGKTYPVNGAQSIGTFRSIIDALL